jgi:EF-P beta-lysylation protein EpmB
MNILAPNLPVVRPRLGQPRGARWQDAMKDAIRDPEELCRLLELAEEVAVAARAAGQQFPLFVPRGYLARMQLGDANDPLLRQVLPIGAELADVAGFTADPVGDLPSLRAPGLLHKYSERALLVASGTCAVHCRYCFRRHYPYAEIPHSIDQWRLAIRAIDADPSIQEVILSGGDPLTIVDDALGELIDQLAAVSHLRRLRIHTRLPIVIPERVTDALVALLRETRLRQVMVVHVNHANELDESVERGLGRLAAAGVMLLNQAVLLRGVNDSVATQLALAERLVDLGVLPYYLHQLDRVVGAAHFEVPVETGRRIVEELRQRLPGYMVPRYVQEVAGAPYKLEV